MYGIYMLIILYSYILLRSLNELKHCALVIENLASKLRKAIGFLR